MSDDRLPLGHTDYLVSWITLFGLYIEREVTPESLYQDVDPGAAFSEATKLHLHTEIPKISPGVIAIRKHIFGGLIFGGIVFGGIIFGGHFVLVPSYQDL